MNTPAWVVAVSAWACALLLPGGTTWRVLQLLVFGLLGTAMTLAGGFQVWWNASMQPTQSSGWLLICGLLTLGSQGATVWHALVAEEFGGDPEHRRDRRRQ